jgi:hypothetical protein
MYISESAVIVKSFFVEQFFSTFSCFVEASQLALGGVRCRVLGEDISAEAAVAKNKFLEKNDFFHLHVFRVQLLKLFTYVHAEVLISVNTLLSPLHTYVLGASKGVTLGAIFQWPTFTPRIEFMLKLAFSRFH